MINENQHPRLSVCHAMSGRELCSAIKNFTPVRHSPWYWLGLQPYRAAKHFEK